MHPAPLSHEEIERLLRIVQTTNVRDATYHDAEAQLIDAGEAVVPYLQNLHQSDDPVTRDRAGEILNQIRLRRRP